MTVPTNVLQDVQTYNDANLALLQNMCPVLSNCNKAFDNFQNVRGNKGTTVTFDRPPRYVGNPSLTAVFEASEQEKISLTVDKAFNVASAFTVTELIYNLENNFSGPGDSKTKRYIEKFGKAAISEMATYAEADVSEMAVNDTYRFFGDGVTAIDSHQLLATALARYREYGAPQFDYKAFLPNMSIPSIIGSGLTDFVLNRNEKEANSWELGSFDKCEWFRSNLLPLHLAGTVGNDDTTLVITALVTDGDGGISAITCSGAGTESEAIKENDLLQFEDGVTGHPNVRFRSWVGHKPVDVLAQIKATADAGSTADSITIPIFPKLYSTVSNKQNVTQTIAVGMELKSVPNHRAGFICAGKAMYSAMPKLLDKSPYDTVLSQDEQTGASIRMYSGSTFGVDEQGTVHDMIWGKKAVEEYMMRLVFPEFS